MDIPAVFEKTQRDTVDGGITPTLVEETSSTIKMFEILLIRGRSPEIQIRNLEITPEMAGAVAICLFIVIWSSVFVLKPFDGVVGVEVMAVCCEEADGFGPEGGDGLG